MTADSTNPPEQHRPRGRGESARSTAAARPSASIETLKRRSELLAAVRKCFADHGYWEVETPLLSRGTIVDAWLEPFTTRETADEGAAELFLQTSPEFGMKRLLAAGATAIYQITRAFRRGEAGRLHNPEFTMLEWYRTGASYREQMDFTETLVQAVFARAGGPPSGRCPADASGKDADAAALCDASSMNARSRPTIRTPFDRLAYDEAFARYAGSPVLKLRADELADLAKRRGVSPPASLRSDDRDGWLNLLLAELVEPHLGCERPVFLYDYPASQASLATVREADPPVAERFELYAAGVELCNGYQELTDAAEFMRRMQRQLEIRAREGLRPLPIDDRLVDAMQGGLPACAGVALGFDRLVMLALGKRSFAEVAAFPFERA